MQSFLDDGRMWSLERTVFDGRLGIHLVELIRAAEPETVVISGHAMGPAYALEVTPDSRRASVVFDDPVAYKCVNESYESSDQAARRIDGDEGYIKVFESSTFLNQIRANGIVDAMLAEPVREYMVFTDDYVFRVASAKPPRVELMGK